MSDFGTLMDRIVAAAEAAVSGLDAERGNRPNDQLETFPHLLVYGGGDLVSRASLGQKVIRTTVQARLVTRSETQEDFLLKRDAVRDAIESDATLLALATDVLVVSTTTEENPALLDKQALMAVQIDQEA